MAATAKPLPLEAYFAHKALHVAIGASAKQTSPIPASTDHLVAGAHVYRTHCAGCHGLPNEPESSIAPKMFPEPPKLFEPDEMVTDDPVGVTHWKVENGIRLSGMPAFGKALTQDEIWEVSLLLGHADQLPPEEVAELKAKAGGGR